MRNVKAASLFASALALGFPFTLTACGGADHTANAPTAPVDADAGVATPTAHCATAADALPTTWSDSMSKDQQMAFMKKKVIGPLGETFKDHDKARYADFSCKTCHGPQYQNPHAFLPHLKLEGENLTAFKTDPDVAKFMHEKVVRRWPRPWACPSTT